MTTLMLTATDPQLEASASVARIWAGKQTACGPAYRAKAIDRYIADLKARKGETAAKLTEVG